MRRSVGSSELQAVAEEFRTWRRRKVSPKERMPRELWAKAVALSQSHSTSELAKHLKINHTVLKQRLKGKSSPPKAQVLKLAPIVLSSQTSSSSKTSSAVIELLAPSGVRLSLSGLRVDEVIKAFVEACR